MHLIRPLIKPYVSTVDPLLDLARMFGDIFFFVSTTCLQHAQSWWSVSLWDIREIETGPDSAVYGNLATLETAAVPDTSAYPAVVPQMSEPSQSSLEDRQRPISRIECAEHNTQAQYVPSENGNSKEHLLEVPVRTRRQSVKTDVASTAGPTMTAPLTSRSGRRGDGMDGVEERNVPLRQSLDALKPHEPQVYRWQLNESNSKAPVSHEIWHPPLSAYEGLVDSQAQGTHQPSYTRSRRSSATADATPPRTELDTSEILEVDEWRLYPPFPSAYPPTPLPVFGRLPSTIPNATVSTPRRPSDRVQFPPIKEENGRPFPRSLMPGEPSNPGSKPSISDDNILSFGVQNHDCSSDEESMDVSSDDEDSGDSFNITLRTPRRKRIEKLPPRRPQSDVLLSPSVVSSSKLSTVDNGSTLRTRSNSESSSTMSSSDASSIAGHKRSFREVDEIDLQKTVKPVEKTHPKPSSKSGQVSSHRSKHHPRTPPIDNSASRTVDEDESEHGGSLGSKRRRVAKNLRGASGSSSTNLSLVPPKDDVVHGQATANHPPLTTRGRGRGRGLAPSRSSSRIAGSQTAPPISRSTSASSNSSQTNVSNVQTGKPVPPLRNKNTRNGT